MQTQTTRESVRNAPRAPVDDETLLNSGQVKASVGDVTDMCLWRWTRDPRVQFPAPDMVINGRRYWQVGTIRRWKTEQAAKAAKQSEAA